jgi:hypothetical protein
MAFCDAVERLYFVHKNKRVRCPVNLNDGATCGSGGMTYLNGSWHDGLELDAPIVNDQLGLTAYVHRSDFLLGNSTSFYPCPGGDAACIVDASGKLTCQHGGHGVLCAVCMEGFVRSPSSNSCVRCGPASGAMLAVVAIAVVVLMCVLPAAAMAWTRLGLLMGWLWSEFKLIRAKVKLTFVFYQVTLLVGSVFAMPYHRLPGYAALCRALSIFSFDFDFLQLGCFSFSYTFHTKLYLISAVALFLEVAAAMSVLGYRCVAKFEQQMPKKIASKIASWMLVGTYVLYPSACATIFSTFNCAIIDGARFLVVDYSIKCDRAEHIEAERWAFFMIVVFAVGLPALYLYLLKKSQLTSTADDDEMMAFFSADYKPQYFYW